MSAVGWTVALGATTMANDIVNTGVEADNYNWFKIPVATALLGVVVNAAEQNKNTAPFVGILVGIAFITAMIAPLGGKPSPVENAFRFARSFDK